MKIRKICETKTILNIINYGLGGFILGSLLWVFISFPTTKIIKIFPSLLGETKEEVDYCLRVSPVEMTKNEIISCNDIEFRTSFLQAGLMVATIGFFYSFSKNKSVQNNRRRA